MNLVIFDVDGTLLDNLASEDACYAAALADGLGLESVDTNWRAYQHVTDEGVAREAYQRAFGIAPSPVQISQTIDRFIALLADANASAPLSAVAGAAEMLAALPASGWIPALATGAWRRAARFKLAAAGIRIAHLTLATAEDGPARVDIVKSARARASREQASVGRVVLVGDAVWDVAAARELGLPFVGRATGERAVALRQAGATALLADFTSIDAVLAAFETAEVMVDDLRMD